MRANVSYENNVVKRKAGTESASVLMINAISSRFNESQLPKKGKI